MCIFAILLPIKMIRQKEAPMSEAMIVANIVDIIILFVI
jgi:hypothetical protein